MGLTAVEVPGFQFGNGPVFTSICVIEGMRFAVTRGGRKPGRAAHQEMPLLGRPAADVVSAVLAMAIADLAHGVRRTVAGLAGFRPCAADLGGRAGHSGLSRIFRLHPMQPKNRPARR